MDPEKAPGPDGLSAGFFKDHWEILKFDILSCVRDFLNGGVMPDEFNRSHIILTKINHPKSVSDYRPISLCNTVYKLVAKVLANRLKCVLSNVISANQSAFVPGRLISDNVALAFELIHKLKQSKTGSDCFCAIKTDMSKAFDRVEWVFLREMMASLGFSSTWISWVMRCVSSVSFAVLINGVPGKVFSPERGLRQGDPLSPFLFVICSEGLSCYLKFAELEGSITGCSIARSGPRISHLFFADDSVFFVRAEEQDALALEGILDDFGAASGQAINRDKSGIFFSPNTPRRHRELVSRAVNFSEVLAHDKYLGMPLITGRAKSSCFRGIVDRVWKKLNGWSSRFLSSAGKEVLIKSVIQAIPSYVMNCFSLPKKILSEIEKAIRCFWWGGMRKTRWVGWKVLTRAKSKGGLGFRDLRAFNLALLAKQGWRILNEPDSLLAQSFKAKYFPNSSFFEAKLGSRPSYIWRSILEGRDILRRGGIWRIGDGKSVRIFEDEWVPGVIIASVPRLFPAVSSVLYVSLLINSESNSWDVGALHNFFDSVTVDAIVKIPICSRDKDIFAWKFTKNSQFSVRSAYFVAEQVSAQSVPEVPDSAWWSNLWNLSLVPKAKIFLWRLSLQCLPTRDKLLSRRLIVDGTCPVCGCASENIAHLFMTCRWAVLLWSSFCPGLNPISFQNENFVSWYCRLQPLLDGDQWFLFNSLLWLTWKNRNLALFESTCWLPESAICMAKQSLEDLRFSNSLSCGFAPSTKWQKPPNGLVKVNCDAAIFANLSKIGIGIVIRNCSGRVILCKSVFLDGNSDILQAEALALLTGVALAKDAGYRDAIFESDALIVIQEVRSMRPSFLYCRNVIREIKELVQSFDSHFFVYAKRMCNRLAHELANRKLNEQGELPFSLLHIASLDLS